jgi:hypothetical protein
VIPGVTAALIGGLRPYSSSRQEMAGRTTPRRTDMSDPKPDAKNGVKTLGIRLPDELHAQFALVAQLDGLSLTDAIRRAVEHFVATKCAEPDFNTRAAAVLEEIEREAASRRTAIQALFGGTAEAAEPATTRKGRATS